LSATADSGFFFTTKSTKDTKGDLEDRSLYAVFEFGYLKIEHEACLDARKLHDTTPLHGSARSAHSVVNPTPDSRLVRTLALPELNHRFQDGPCHR
jgi:hypothetical protein